MFYIQCHVHYNNIRMYYTSSVKNHEIGVNEGLEPSSPALTVQRSIQLS